MVRPGSSPSHRLFVAVGGGSAAEGTVPAFGRPVLAGGGAVDPGVSKQYLAGTKEETGAANVVTAILLDYRAYDTLGEATVILVSVLGVYVILRPVGRRKEGKES